MVGAALRRPRLLSIDFFSGAQAAPIPRVDLLGDPRLKFGFPLGVRTFGVDRDSDVAGLAPLKPVDLFR